ncbi:unnamed protein product, partial [Heterosigma akashiwo]
EKEFRFKGLIGEHDLAVRARQVCQALGRGHRVTVSVVANRKHLRVDPHCGERVVNAVLELTRDHRSPQEVGKKKSPNPMIQQFVLHPK